MSLAKGKITQVESSSWATGRDLEGVLRFFLRKSEGGWNGSCGS
jgi:hypothetical protein